MVVATVLEVAAEFVSDRGLEGDSFRMSGKGAAAPGAASAPAPGAASSTRPLAGSDAPWVA